VAAAFTDADGAKPAGRLASLRDHTLSPQMSIKACMALFDSTESDELAVVDDDGRPLGVLSEAYATRRYAEELEKVRRDLIGTDS
jgi:CIC family chloride channel protein